MTIAADGANDQLPYVPIGCGDFKYIKLACMDHYEIDVVTETVRTANDMNESSRQAMVAPIDLKYKLRQFDAHWSPKRVAGFNGHDIMLVKALGDFDWHVHEETDDFFMVLSGTLTVHLRDRNVQVGAGELYIVPAGVEHRTSATKEAHLLLIEPAGTPNTGDPSSAAVVEVI